MRDVMGHLEGQMFITDSHTLYSRVGDTPIVIASLLIVLLTLIKKK